MTEKKIGINIRKIRELRGYSQEILADMVDSSQKKISRIELGQQSPNFIFLGKISKALEVNINILLNFDENNLFSEQKVEEKPEEFSEDTKLIPIYKKLLEEKNQMIELLLNKITSAS